MTLCCIISYHVIAMWSTRLTMDESKLDDPNVKAITILRELGLYCVFLLILCVCKFMCGDMHSEGTHFGITRFLCWTDTSTASLSLHTTHYTHAHFFSVMFTPRHVFSAIWETSSLMDKEAAESSEKKACVLIRELVIYCVFLILLCVSKWLLSFI